MTEFKTVEGHPIKVKPAQSEDCENLYNWRNEEINRRFSLNPEIIPYEAHIEWFNKKVNNPACKLLIGYIDNNPLGVVRLDHSNSHSHDLSQYVTVSIYLVPGMHGKGYGKFLLSESLKKAEAYEAIAFIFPQNIASVKTFEKCGFIWKGNQNDMTLYKKLIN